MAGASPWPEGVTPPKMSPGFLGPQTKWAAYGMQAVSHPHHHVAMAADQTEVEFILATPPGTRMTVKLLSCEAKKDVTEFVLTRKLGDNFCFLVRPPWAGFYKFQLYALPGDEAGPAMACVYNYLLCCPAAPPTHDRPFPKQYPPWKQGCYLHEPLSLPTGTRIPDVRFKIEIPRARDVQVKVADAWNPLAPLGEGRFEGLVDFTQGHPPGAKAKVNVNFQGRDYLTLLEYTL